MMESVGPPTERQSASNNEVQKTETNFEARILMFLSWALQTRLRCVFGGPRTVQVGNKGGPV